MEFNGTFLAVIISFLVFVYLMNKVLYIPMLYIIRERKSYIESNMKKAFDNNEKTETISNDIDKQLIEAKDSARNKYNEVIDDYKNQKATIVQNAQIAVSKELENAYSELDNISNEAKENLKSKMNDLANDIIEKVLGYRTEIQEINNDKVDEIFYRSKG